MPQESENEFNSDTYTHDQPYIYYIVSSIPGPGADEVQVLTEGCKCNNSGIPCNGCSCANSRPNFRIHNKTKILNSNILENQLLFECHSACKCSKWSNPCLNRCVQLGPVDSLVVANYLGKGYGLKTSRQLYKHQFVCEYAGEYISESEAYRRIQQNFERNCMNYVFIVNEFFNMKKVTTCVDPAIFGNIGRYINHSCQPNCFVLPVRVEWDKPRICIFALRDISADEEITFDYSCGEESSVLSKNRKCFCGFENCRGFLPGV